jgi:hypothetical protein
MASLQTKAWLRTVSSRKPDRTQGVHFLSFRSFFFRLTEAFIDFTSRQ